MKTKLELLYDYAMSFVGLPYIWGGDDPILGFDCSGLVLELLQAVGEFPSGDDMTAHGLFQRYSSNRLEHPQFGALVFFGRPEKVTHVGFCLNSALMLEAGGGGSKTVHVKEAAKQNAYVRIRPISNRRDLVGFALPNY